MGAFGILFLAIGAILTFALDASVAGIDLDAVGVILMVVGVVGVIASLARDRLPGTVSRTERVVSNDGSHLIEKRRTEQL